ncbi:unnamed protein product, partial [Adineta steineri]
MDNKSFENDFKTNTVTPDQSSIPTNSTIQLWPTNDKSQPGEDNIHSIPVEELYNRYHTNPQTGLSEDSISDTRAYYGYNRLTPPEPPNYFLLLIKQLFTGFNSILWFAGILAFLAYKPFGESESAVSNLALGIVIFIVIICNSILNVYQQLKSIKIVAAFSKLIPALATVRRDGREQQIVTDEIVPGDIILVRMGDKLPADCRFISCDGVKVNTSELTGESKPVSITVRCSSATFMESTNIGFYSTMVEQGTGEAVVIATGDNTILGKMSKLTRGSSGDEVTGLHREVNRFVLFVVLATITAIAILWITWAAWLDDDHPGFVTFNANIVNSVGMIVAFLPMGLPSAVTLALTVVAQKMYRQRVLVKSLQIVETFNAVSVIATDKTGTLTQNKMTVTHLLWDNDGVYKVPMPRRTSEEQNNIFSVLRRISSGAIQIARRLSDSTADIVRRLSSSSQDETERVPLVDNNNEKSDESKEPSEIKIQAFRDLLLGAALCNNAEKQAIKDMEFEDDEVQMKSKVQLVGDAADTALYILCKDQCSMNIERVRKVNPRLKVLPFNSSNKFMITANQLELLDGSKKEQDRIVLVTMKGAPDIVIQRCSTYKTSNGEIVSLNDDMKKTLFNRQEVLGKTGYRVIAMSQLRFTRQEYDEMITKQDNKQTPSTSQEGEDLNGFPSNNYCFIGLFSLLDPPRPEVPDAVLKARRAQIRVAMVTGDHPTTAKAIAKQVNILTTEIADMNGVDTFKLEKDQNGKSMLHLYRNDKLVETHEPGEIKRTDSLSKNAKDLMRRASIASGDLVVTEPPWYERTWIAIRSQFMELESDVDSTNKMEYIPYAIVVAGAEINYMDDFMWDWVLSHQELVFARTSPEQKLKIVSEFQRRGEVVAVTGDGTNDAPALK